MIFDESSVGIVAVADDDAILVLPHASAYVSLEILSLLDAVATLGTVEAVLVEVERLAVALQGHLVLEAARAEVALAVSNV